jgi:hypothetical protein
MWRTTVDRRAHVIAPTVADLAVVPLPGARRHGHANCRRCGNWNSSISVWCSTAQSCALPRYASATMRGSFAAPAGHAASPPSTACAASPPTVRQVVGYTSNAPPIASTAPRCFWETGVPVRVRSRPPVWQCGIKSTCAITGHNSNTHPRPLLKLPRIVQRLEHLEVQRGLTRPWRTQARSRRSATTT